MDAVKTVSLGKRYMDVTAVKNLSIEIREGELFSLLGVNGAGKTTTIKILTGLTRPTSGKAYVGGFDILSETSSLKRVLAVSPQETAVAPNLTVEENLENFLPPQP